MTAELKVHPSFFREFATKTWVSPNEIVKELIENAFDEDATQVIVTILKDGSVVIEDNAGMDQKSMEKFLLLGSPHKTHDPISPKLKRIRTGRYGTGRLSFLTSFEKMKIRTRQDDFNLSILIDGNTLDNLFSGNARLEMLKELPLSRNGTELSLMGSKLSMDTFRLSKEIRKLAILRQPMFEVCIKSADNFVEWDFNDAQLIKAPDIQGHRIPVDLDNGIVGEIVIARRPLSEDEKGIAVMVGNHVVTRSNFGFDTKFNRVTGYVRCDALTSRFADKSALIEDEEYTKFNRQMKAFIIDVVIPGLTQYEDVLITREESKIYKEIDKVLGQAIIDNIESGEEVQGYEMVDIKDVAVGSEAAEPSNLKKDKEIPSHGPTASYQENKENNNILTSPEQKKTLEETGNSHQHLQDSEPTMLNYSQQQQQQQTIPKESLLQMADPIAQHARQQAEDLDPANKEQPDRTLIKVRKPIIKKTFALKKIGYKVVPYEDESDSRYSFTNENVVFVNKANSTYRAEASRGDEFLLRHIIGIVAEVIAETKHPEGKDALEFLNRLVSEAIRIHDDSVIKK
ncbi:MAG TPA: ATP-binding protein [Nitrososphaeraceae archaeon]|nr:ATP-binding protein [Nitrososphaeraceae archaeon]